MHFCVNRRHSATHLQHTATHCNTLQHNATHCNTLQHTTTLRCALPCSDPLQQTATHCNTLQHTALVLQRVLGCCSCNDFACNMYTVHVYIYTLHKPNNPGTYVHTHVTHTQQPTHPHTYIPNIHTSDPSQYSHPHPCRPPTHTHLIAGVDISFGIDQLPGRVALTVGGSQVQRS